MEHFLYKWLHTVYMLEVQPTTFARALQVVRTHLLPSFGYREVHSITTYDIQNFLSKKTQDKLSPATVKIIRNTLSKAFQTALDWELIKKNPIERVKLPKIEKNEKHIWTVEEAKQFLDHCEVLRWKVAFSLALHTGLRRGELMALKWQNIDLENRTIKIKESLAYTKEQGLFFTTPKTANSVRELVISSSLIGYLKLVRDEHKKMKERMGPAYHENDLVICTAEGKPVQPRNLARTFDRLIEKAKVKKISLHGLRHTNATLLMKQGINPKIVSERLGHSNVSITLDIYSHTDLAMQEESVSRLEELLI